MEEMKINPDAICQILDVLTEHKFNVCQNDNAIKQFRECFCEMIKTEAKEQLRMEEIDQEFHD